MYPEGGAMPENVEIERRFLVDGRFERQRNPLKLNSGTSTIENSTYPLRMAL